jgi:mycothiol synthase
VRRLSSPFTARAATAADADGILAVGIARDIADLGYPDYDIDDVRDELADAGSAWVVLGGGGEVVAAALLDGAHGRVLVHPDACGNGIGTWLREQVEEAHGEGVIRQQVDGSNDPARRLLEDAGYRVEQHYWRMMRELGEPVAAVPWPDGAPAREYDSPGDDVAAHALVQDTFTDIPGNVERSLEEWLPRAVGRAQFVPALSTVAGDFAGVALCEVWDGDQGYVAYLATARDWRGRGLGRALLATSLEKMRAAGLRQAALSVNARNESATRLYESVGMRVAARSDRYEKQL